ncbi:hypothetical protein [Boseongicola sp. H5]|uniref:hypothetical protein n=1 Tax=Boseongicola sp. H5 TaxID=2763261 RepID=UPI001D0AD1CB|nr:hypothetical protein [Boseongicola sp. H5]
MNFDLRESCLWEALEDDVYVLHMLWDLANQSRRPPRELVSDLNAIFAELRRELPLQLRKTETLSDLGIDIEWKEFAAEDIINERDELAGPPYYWFTLYDTGVTPKQLSECLEKFSG